MEVSKERSKGLDTTKANSEKQGGRIVELGKAHKTNGMRLSRASECSTHRQNMMLPQGVSRRCERGREKKVEQNDKRQVTMLDGPDA